MNCIVICQIEYISQLIMNMILIIDKVFLLQSLEVHCPCPSPVDGVIFSSCNETFSGRLYYTCNATAGYYTYNSWANIACLPNGTIANQPVCTKGQ